MTIIRELYPTRLSGPVPSAGRCLRPIPLEES